MTTIDRVRATLVRASLGSLALLAFAVAPAGAIYAPNPAARWVADQFFLAGDFQFHDKDLEPRGELSDVLGIYARPSYSVAENFVVYGRIGAQEADGLDLGPAIGFGAQAAYVLPGSPRWAIGGAFDFLWWDAETDRRGRDVDYTEFQITPAVGYLIPGRPTFNPYAGMSFDFLGGDLEEDSPVGFLIGSTIDIQPRWRFDVQFRGLHEQGMLLSAGYAF